MMMNTSWTVEEITNNDEKLMAKVKTAETYEKLQTFEASERMLSDSDAQTLIYIIEDADSFTYIRFPITTWGTLKEGMDEDKPLILILHSWDGKKHTLELAGFWTELRGLIENIEGNANYGDEMVGAVEKTFVNS